jgi:polyisoprenoid-binding protein YceI
MISADGKHGDTSTWNIDATHTVAEFKVKHMMISNVKGQFAKVEGVLTLNSDTPEKSRIVASIDAASLDTRDS